jgi:hypothetical protein
MGNTGGYQEEIAARGYAFGSSNTFKNGARYNNGAMPEMSGLKSRIFKRRFCYPVWKCCSGWYHEYRNEETQI